MEKLYISLLIGLIVGGITLGNALAITFNENVIVDNNGPTGLTIKADTGQANIQFSDVGTRVFVFTMIDGTGTFAIGDATAGFSRLAIDSEGNVGIGTNNPAERLDVKGSIKLAGNIVSDGDICIGACT